VHRGFGAHLASCSMRAGGSVYACKAVGQ